MSDIVRILIVEDTPEDVELVVRELRKAGFEPQIERVDHAEAFEAALDRQRWDVVLCDYVLPAFGWLEALQRLQTGGLDLPFIVISGKIPEEGGAEAMKAGAHDFIVKGKMARLAPVIRREIAEANSRAEKRRVEQERRRYFAEKERSGIELEQFAQAISRDLAEPLEKISRALDQLGQELKGKLTDKSVGLFCSATEEIPRMQAMVEALQGYCRTERDQRPLERLDLRTVVQEAVSNLGKTLEENKVKVEWADLPKIQGSRAELLFVFQCLFDIFVRMAAGKPCTVGISAQRYGDEWLIAVRDNLPVADQKMIAWMSQVLEGSTRGEAYPRPEVRLLVSRKLIERHQGKIKVEHKAKEGTSFYLLLPKSL